MKKGTRLPYSKNVNVIENLPEHEKHAYAIQMTRNKFLNPTHTNEFIGAFANMCRAADKRKGYCSGNAGNLKPTRDYKSATVNLTKNLKKGDELFVSYGSRSYFR